MVRLPDRARAAIVAHAVFCAPEEACGLLAGTAGDVRMVYCLTNVERSRVRFTVSPVEHYHAMRHAERNSWSIIGAFHSHPAAPATPSAVDIAGALDPTWLYVIAGLNGGEPTVRGYAIVGGLAAEVRFSATELSS